MRTCCMVLLHGHASVVLGVIWLCELRASLWYCSHEVVSYGQYSLCMVLFVSMGFVS